jgi:iron-sulfur cluster repair protein YtfE (RIC family)
MTTFSEAKERNLKTLEQYVPIVARVHGGSHPEFHQVRQVFAAMNEKLKAADSSRPDLTHEFEQLREVTGDYAIPGDVCESYAAVYNMLAELDQAYHRG